MEQGISFEYQVFGHFDFLGLHVTVTNTIIGTWIVMAILITLAIIVRIKLNSFKEVPTGFQNFIESIVEIMHKFCISAMGEKYSYFGAWFFTVFAFILLSNLAGLLNLRPPTADITTTAALGLSTFLIIHIFGILKSKGQYFKSYFEPLPFLFPLNIIGEFAIPVSLSFRLFGNILGGVIILGLVYELFPLYLRIGLPSVFHFYFDIFAGVLQSYIFCILSMSFIKQKLPG